MHGSTSPIVRGLQILSLLILLGLAAWSLQRSAAPPATGKGGIKNVLLIVIDTLRADRLGCYGNPRDTSPTMDALAQQGVRFDLACAAWPETSQSMAAVLSGLHNQSNGVQRKTPHAISEELTLLPEILQDQGWQTAAFVTNGVLDPKLNYDQGFDTFVPVWDTEHDETFHVREWLSETRTDDAPFFVWLHYIEPHAPYLAAKPYRHMFVGDEHYYNEGKRVHVYPEEEQWKAVGGIPGFSRIEGHDELDFYLARYDAEIRWTDSKVAKVLATLQDLELAEDTLVILTADHGEGFGEHNYFWHGLTPYDTEVHVPLIVVGPGIAPAVCQQPVSLVDLAPTILEWSGLGIPSFLEGRSLLPLLREPQQTWNRFIFAESGDQPDYQRTIRDGEYKLIYVPSKREQAVLAGSEFELYNTREDPGETHNLIGQHPGTQQAMQQALQEWMASAQDLTSGEDGEISDDVRRMAAELGYVQDEEEDEQADKKEDEETSDSE